MSSPSTPSPAAHHFARFCQRSGRGTGGHLVRFWAMLSPPHRQRPAASKQQGNASTFCHTARLVLVLFLQVVRKGSEPARAGDSLQLTPSTLSTLPGRTDSAPPRTSGGFGRIFNRSGRTDTQPGYLVCRRSAA